MIMGNQAIALGALKAGVNLAAGYPGTPSSEIIEFIAKYKEKYGESADAINTVTGVIINERS